MHLQLSSPTPYGTLHLEHTFPYGDGRTAQSLPRHQTVPTRSRSHRPSSMSMQSPH